MIADADWLATAIRKARERGTAAPEAVWAMIESHLRGKFRERLIPPKELAGIALELIAEMVPTPASAQGPT
jgi:hypothetical protein